MPAPPAPVRIDRRWYSPEWLSRYNARTAATDTPLTPKAHAALLLMVGEYSSAEYDIGDPGHADPVTNIRAGRNGPLVDGIYGRMPYADMRRILGYDKTRDLERVMRIAEGAKLGAEPGHYPLGFTSTETGQANWVLQFPMTTAHPLTSKSKLAAPVDVSSIAAMTSAHSVSIALRAIVWTRTACESGLGRLVFDRRTNGLHIDIPRARIQTTLGLSMAPTIKTLARLIPMWIADLALVHIEAEFTVVRDGKSIVALRVRFRSLPVTVYGQSAYRTRRAVSLYTETIQTAPAVDTVAPSPKRSYAPRKPRPPADPAPAVFGVPMTAFEASTQAPIPPRPSAPRRPPIVTPFATSEPMPTHLTADADEDIETVGDYTYEAEELTDDDFF